MSHVLLQSCLTLTSFTQTHLLEREVEAQFQGQGQVIILNGHGGTTAMDLADWICPVHQNAHSVLTSLQAAFPVPLCYISWSNSGDDMDNLVSEFFLTQDMVL